MAAKQLSIFTGKRKTANARTRIALGSGKILINGKNYTDYFCNRAALIKVVEDALRITGNFGKYDVFANVRGGGVSAQADAVRHGIAKALIAENQDFRLALKRNGFITRDSREVERKKYGRSGARKLFQFSKR